jgi:hypothetical protein
LDTIIAAAFFFAVDEKNGHYLSEESEYNQ